MARRLLAHIGAIPNDATFRLSLRVTGCATFCAATSFQHSDQDLGAKSIFSQSLKWFG